MPASRPASAPAAAASADPIRAKIEAMGNRLDLPTVAKALGVIEGEHSSHRSGGSDELMDVRAYEPGDEARLIEWKTSARQGRPMVVRRERLVTSRVWLLLDVGREMTASCESGELAYQVAANALRMFAALVVAPFRRRFRWCSAMRRASRACRSTVISASSNARWITR